MTIDNNPITRATTAGKRAFGVEWTPDRTAAAPGRLEVLGNHVDYSGGKVIAAAIDRKVAVVSRTSGNDGLIEVAFGDFEGPTVVVLRREDLVDWRNDTPPPKPEDYVRGAVAAVHSRGLFDLQTGMQHAISGDVPIGLGLSSSAALCVALTLSLSSKPLEKRELVLIAQEAEHRAGTPCGTMDQSASAAGGFILFDSETVTFEQLQPSLGDLALAVADSGVSRSLGASSYPIRVKESQIGLKIARKELDRDLSNLAELSVSDLDTLNKLDESRIAHAIFHRIRHIVTENERVREGYEALQQGDWDAFGSLMTASGRSSAIDYEISHPRVEELVALSLEVEGVLGARMMGGGEGGTALILANKASIPKLEQRLAESYYSKYGISAGLYVFGNAPGASLAMAH
jgi:galactokinase